MTCRSRAHVRLVIPPPSARPAHSKSGRATSPARLPRGRVLIDLRGSRFSEEHDMNVVFRRRAGRGGCRLRCHLGAASGAGTPFGRVWAVGLLLFASVCLGMRPRPNERRVALARVGRVAKPGFSLRETRRPHPRVLRFGHAAHGLPTPGGEQTALAFPVVE